MSTCKKSGEVQLTIRQLKMSTFLDEVQDRPRGIMLKNFTNTLFQISLKIIMMLLLFPKSPSPPQALAKLA